MNPRHQQHAFTDDAMGTLDATGLAEALGQGHVSAPEVMAASIARAERINPEINGIVTSDYVRAHERALRPPSGPFSGIPFLIKDNIPLAGLPTGFGSEAIDGKPARANNAVSRQLLAQGLIPLGKSTLPEFGFNASTEFAQRRPTVNPWHREYSAGASSGGSAAMVAAGVVPMAHANDGGGSIRIPAACCGLVGLKPSRGRLCDSEAARSLPINIIGEGVLTRTVRDTAAFYAHAERLHPARGLPPIGPVQGPGRKRLRIALVTDSINGSVTDRDTREVTENTAHQLAQCGHGVETFSPDVDPRFPEDFTRYWAMLGFIVSHTGKITMAPSFQKRHVDNLTRGLERKFRQEMHKLPGTLWRLRRSAQLYRQALKGFDAVLCPVVAHTTPKLGYLSPRLPFSVLFPRLEQYASFTPMANATGAPAIALPAGQTQEGLPIGVQLMAHHGQERLLLELAYELEAAAPWPFLWHSRQKAGDSAQARSASASQCANRRAMGQANALDPFRFTRDSARARQIKWENG
ncbi:MAG: amidase [Oleiphilaceae bacterium]|nr:amidase [Oleiphilaceae bacterium]